MCEIRNYDSVSVRNAMKIKCVLSAIHPVLEYACPAWHTNIAQYFTDSIEMVPKRAMRSIFPSRNYEEALQKTHAADPSSDEGTAFRK